MKGVDRNIWALLDIIGMVLVIAGAVVIMTQFPYPKMSEVILALGIILIVVSSFFIFLDGRNLRKEDERYRSFEKKRTEVRKVPNDLKDGYLIDLSSDEGIEVSYTSNDAETDRNSVSSDDIVVYYPK